MGVASAKILTEAVGEPQAFVTPTVYKPVALTTMVEVFVLKSLHVKLLKLLVAVKVALAPLHNRVEVDATVIVGEIGRASCRERV